MVNGHALCAPSAMGRIVRCPASVALSYYNGDSTVSREAGQGSVMHRVAEDLLKTGLHADLTDVDDPEVDLALSKAELTLINECPDLKEIDRIVALEQCIDYAVYVTSTIGENPLCCETEVVIPVDWFTGEHGASGRADCVAVTAAGDLHVFDFKSGAGVKVDGVNNLQLITYAIGAMRLLPDLTHSISTPSSVHIHVIQPAMENFSHQVLTEELIKEAMTIIHTASQRALYLVEHPNEIRVGTPYDPTPPAMNATGDQLPVTPMGDYSEVGPHCQFCHGRRICPSHLATVNTALQSIAANEVMTVPNVPESLPLPDTPERLMYVYAYVPVIRKWLDEVESKAFDTVAQRGEFMGYKIVMGKAAGRRNWSDAEKAEKILRKALSVNDVFDKKLISVATAEKLHETKKIGPRYWRALSDLIVRSDPKPQLVESSDPRDPLNPNLDNDFD